MDQHSTRLVLRVCNLAFWTS